MKTTKEKFAEIDGRIKLVNQKIDLIIKNHLHHMKKDIDRISMHINPCLAKEVA